ncbi:MAG: hypothetical protein ACRD1G_14710 [Acidimicrobiales bacterium]
MSAPDYPAGTETAQLLAAQAEQGARIDRLTDAVNGLGQNTQWIIERAEGLFQMLGSPQFMSVLGPMIGGMTSGSTAGPEDSTTAGPDDLIAGTG